MILTGSGHQRALKHRSARLLLAGLQANYGRGTELVSVAWPRVAHTRRCAGVLGGVLTFQDRWRRHRIPALVAPFSD